MPRKLFIFGIGGTGSRVLKALTLLFASGVKLDKEFETVVPIIIDPDIANGDLSRTKEILTLYQEIRSQVHEPDDFFYQEIKTVNEISDTSSSISPDYFQFQLNNTGQDRFREYIDFASLSEDLGNGSDKNFARLLYSDANLNSKLDVGFKGNPNIGSIVLNQFTNSKEFAKFAQIFNDGDAVFIINSIFGGTGAAGFPLLLKNLRGNSNLPNHARIRGASIGGITYLPYFSLDAKDEINHESFEEKAKIALDYYNRTIIKTNQINSLYFIGNKGNTNFEKYAVGGTDQKNKAHFLELAGALAIIDFCKNINAQTDNCKVKEFGILEEQGSINFKSLDKQDIETLAGPLTKYKLFVNYLNFGLYRALRTSRWTKSNIKLVGKHRQSPLNRKYFESADYENQVKKVNSHFNVWLDEMSNNKPLFVPFNSNLSASNAMQLRRDVESMSGGRSFKSLDIENCKLIEDASLRHENKTHTTLIKVFGKSTDKVLRNKGII